MRLSTAIRIGSMTTRQIRGEVADKFNGRCAVGAALDAVGCEELEILQAWPVVFLCKFPDMNRHMCRAITNLNDNKHWTREKIADWIERVENLRERKADRKQEEPEYATR